MNQLGKLIASRRLEHDQASPAADGELFRPEALRRRTTLFFARPITLTPPSWSIVSLLLIAGVCTAIIIAVTARFHRMEKVTGVLTPVGGQTYIYAERSGTVVSLHVQEAEKVNAGATLLELRTDQALMDGSSVERNLQDLLMAQSKLATEEALQRQGSALAELEAESQAGRAGQERLTNLRAQLDTARERTQMAQVTADEAQPLFEKGYLSRLEMQRRLEKVLDARSEEQRILSQISEAESARRVSALNVARIRARAEADALRATSSAQQLLERQLTAKREAGASIRAPREGVVSGLRVTRGARVQAGEPILAIVPMGAPLYAELRIPSKAIGFLRRGDRVRLLYDAFPFQKFGAGSGKVVSVSAAPIAASTDEASPAEGADAFYVVRVALNEQSITAYGSEHRLRSGMTLQADIILQERTAVEWLLDPILATTRRL